MARGTRRESWRYSRFDGTQQPFDLDGDDILSSLSDDLLYHGDLAAALRRLLREGFDTRDGDHVEGLRELMERLRQRREELGSQRNEMAEHVAEVLDEVLTDERSELERRRENLASAPDPATARSQREEVAAHETELDLLPPDLSGQIQGLMSYDFTSDSARERFSELLDELRERFTQNQLDEAAGRMASSTPEEREHLRAGLDALNRMIEQRAAGEELDPSFEQFMSEFGDLFPGNPENLDQLLEDLGRRMAAASAMIASMTPGQRAQLDQLMASVMADLDLSWQLDRLGMNLRDALRDLPWDQPVGPPGGDPLSFLGASDALRDLADLSRLEELLSSATEPGALAEADLEEASRLLGPDATRSLEALAELTRRLEAAGLVARRDGRLVLTPAGLRRLGQNALSELFARLRRDRFGDHARPTPGLGHDRDVETKPYEFGDPFQIEIGRTLRNAMLREASAGAAPAGRVQLPIRLSSDDFEIERTEQVTTSSTVLAIDLSLSMPMRDNFLAAKKVAIALQALIASRYPRDYLGLVGFSATAREIRPDELPEVSWDFAYGTNLQHALALSRRMLAHRAGSKQVIVVTDGEPTAHVMANGEVFFNYPPVRETLDTTLSEVARCTREHIVINTFVLDQTGGLRSFVERMTRLNRGRAFYTTPESLGDYLLVDFVEHRSGGQRRRVRHGA